MIWMAIFGWLLIVASLVVGAYASWLLALTSGGDRGGCDAFLSWDKAKVRGVLRPVAGLTRRRNEERAVCLRGVA